jgi:hypothetical protein
MKTYKAPIELSVDSNTVIVRQLITTCEGAAVEMKVAHIDTRKQVKYVSNYWHSGQYWYEDASRLHEIKNVLVNKIMQLYLNAITNALILE